MADPADKHVAAVLGGVLVLALLVLSVVVILAVTHHDPPTPQVDNTPSQVAGTQ